jgi:hypothetical protein
MATFTSDSGKIISLDTLGGGAYSTAITSDRYGNFYVGGQFSSTLYVASNVLNSTGGETDFFLAKYGTPNCTVPQKDSGTGINNIAIVNNEDVKIYPNPTSGQLFIDGAVSGTLYRVYNILGQQVVIGTINNRKEEVNMEELRTGTYILQLTDKNGNRISRTVVKQ